MLPPDGVAGEASGPACGGSRALPNVGSGGFITGFVSQPALGRRGDLFSMVAVLGFVNGIAHRTMLALTTDPARSLEDAFGISAVVWIALVASIVLFRTGPSAPIGSRDVKLFFAALLIFVLPVAPLSWVALSAFAVYVIATSPAGSTDARAGAIVLGLTVPLFWSRLLFTLMSDTILRIDAAMAAFIIGTGRVGNAVAFRDGWGYFWIAPGCSSISNISLAVLTWLLVTRAFYPDRRPSVRYCFYAALAVVAVNVARISYTGLARPNYDIVHSGIGNTLSGIVALFAMFAVCIHGARRAPMRASMEGGESDGARA